MFLVDDDDSPTPEAAIAAAAAAVATVNMAEQAHPPASALFDLMMDHQSSLSAMQAAPTFAQAQPVLDVDMVPDCSRTFAPANASLLHGTALRLNNTSSATQNVSSAAAPNPLSSTSTTKPTTSTATVPASPNPRILPSVLSDILFPKQVLHDPLQKELVDQFLAECGGQLKKRATYAVPYESPQTKQQRDANKAASKSHSSKLKSQANEARSKYSVSAKRNSKSPTAIDFRISPPHPKV